MFTFNTDFKGIVMKLTNIQILLLRLVIGALFASAAVDKYNAGWLTNAEPLSESLTNYQHRAAGIQLAYLEHVAIPYTGIWTKLITVGEACMALSLILGLLVRLSSAVGLFMVLNLHAANGNLFTLGFFESPWAALLVAGLLIMVLARAGRLAGIDALLAMSNSKGILW